MKINIKGWKEGHFLIKFLIIKEAMLQIKIQNWILLDLYPGLKQILYVTF
jgi:hypothetical protein